MTKSELMKKFKGTCRAFFEGYVEIQIYSTLPTEKMFDSNFLSVHLLSLKEGGLIQRPFPNGLHPAKHPHVTRVKKHIFSL